MALRSRTPFHIVSNGFEFTPCGHKFNPYLCPEWQRYTASAAVKESQFHQPCKLQLNLERPLISDKKPANTNQQGLYRVTNVLFGFFERI